MAATQTALVFCCLAVACEYVSGLPPPNEFCCPPNENQSGSVQNNRQYEQNGQGGSFPSGPDYNPSGPAYNPPKPVYRPSDPAYNQPEPVFNPAGPVFNQPGQGYNPSGQGYNPPRPGFNPSGQGYTPPQQGYNPFNQENNAFGPGYCPFGGFNQAEISLRPYRPSHVHDFPPNYNQDLLQQALHQLEQAIRNQSQGQNNVPSQFPQNQEVCPAFSSGFGPNYPQNLQQDNSQGYNSSFQSQNLGARPQGSLSIAPKN